MIDSETLFELVEEDDEWAIENVSKLKEKVHHMSTFYEFPDEQRTNQNLIKLIEKREEAASKIKDPHERALAVHRDMRVVDLPSHGFWNIKKTNVVGRPESIELWY